MLHSCLIVLLSCAIAGCVPKFENGAYKQVNVVFERGMSVDLKQQEILEKLIKVASRELFFATHGMAYFGEVIVMADHIENPSESMMAPKRDFFPAADIRIVRPGVEESSNPFTLQTGECGEEAKFIRLTPNFYKDLDSDDDIKLAARRLVKEWSRYRYGVFDEEESFRWEREGMSPGTCVDGIRGWAMNEHFDRCNLECGRVRGECTFYPDSKINLSGVESSLMSLPQFPQVKLFCNASNHEKKSSSTHNRMCDSESILNVIFKHNDFKAHPHMRVKTTNTALTTRITWTKIDYFYRGFIFIVESSQKVDKEISTPMLQQFLERFFVHLAPRESRTEFIKFSGEARRLWYRLGVWDNYTKAIENVAKESESQSDNVDIGKALDTAFAYYNHHSTVLLISTGDGNIEEEHYKKVKDRNYLVHSIAVGHHRSWKLDHLSQMTGGDSFFLGEKNSRGEPHSFNLDLAFLALMHSSVDDNLRPVIIKYEQITIKNDWEDRYYFQVDEGIGRDIVLTVSCKDGKKDSIYGDYHHEDRRHQYQFGSPATSRILSYVKPGNWSFDLPRESNGKNEIDVLITAKPSGSMQCGWIWACAWIANVTDEKKGRGGSKGYHRIYAEVKKGFNPVIHADVEATVEIQGENKTTKVTLRDNGAGPDVFKDDGIYTNFFPVTERPSGRALVIVRVSNNEGKAKVKMTAECKQTRDAHKLLNEHDRRKAEKKFGASKRRFSADDFETDSTSCDETKEAVHPGVFPLDPFTRVAMANSPILFQMNKTDVKKTPPAEIRDLHVVSEFQRGEEFFALLRWTSPEHPRRGMKVWKIEIFASWDRDVMVPKHISSATQIEVESFVLPPGDIQQMKVKIPPFLANPKDEIRNVYFSARAIDNAGNTGGMSNVAEAFFERPDVQSLSKPAKGKEGSSWLSWTGGVIGVGVLVAGLAYVGYRTWKKMMFLHISNKWASN